MLDPASKPWRVDYSRLGFNHYVYDANGRLVAVVETTHPNAHAHADLIAAAPDLLTALNDATESLSRLPDVDGAYRVTALQQARAAIAKATEGAPDAQDHLPA